MRRKIYDKLVQWKQERNGDTALLIEGARRIGKSYTAEEFARNEYESYILIDFSKAPNRVKSWFENGQSSRGFLCSQRQAETELFPADLQLFHIGFQSLCSTMQS